MKCGVFSRCLRKWYVVMALYCCISVMIWWLTNLAIGQSQVGPAYGLFRLLTGRYGGQVQWSPIIEDVGSISVVAILGLPFVAALLVKGTVVWRSTLVFYGVIIWLFYVVCAFALAAFFRLELH